jgi:hypothetical protein
VALRRVFEDGEVIADPVLVPERTHRGGPIGEQAPLEFGITPGFGDDASAVVRPDLGLIGLDDGVERGRIDIALFGKHRFQRAHAQLHFRQLRAVIVMIVVLMVVCHGNRSGVSCSTRGGPVLLRGRPGTAIIVGTLGLSYRTKECGYLV